MDAIKAYIETALRITNETLKTAQIQAEKRKTIGNCGWVTNSIRSVDE